MLVITSSVGMVHRIHGHTTNLGPAISFGLIFVICTSGFQHRFFNTTTTSNDSNGGTRNRGDKLFFCLMEVSIE